MTARPRVVLVDRRPELDELVDRHSTRGQAEFFLRTRGRSLADVQSAHDAEMAARHQVIAAVPPQWTVAEVDREDLSRFLFLPGDHVVVVGRDGLVANVAKYLDGQPVIGIAPGGGLPPGALVRCALRQGIDLVRSLEAGSALAGGQRQRIGLARALYGAPFLVVLDEPNANLDQEGERALTSAIRSVRARGGIVVVVAHRPSALAGVDTLLVVRGGRLQAFGSKEAVLERSLHAVTPPAVRTTAPAQRALS